MHINTINALQESQNSKKQNHLNSFHRSNENICTFAFPPTSYFFLLAPPPTLPQWREKQYAAVVSEERQQLMDDSEEEEPGESTPGTCRRQIKKVQVDGIEMTWTSLAAVVHCMRGRPLSAFLLFDQIIKEAHVVSVGKTFQLHFDMKGISYKHTSDFKQLITLNTRPLVRCKIRWSHWRQFISVEEVVSVIRNVRGWKCAGKRRYVGCYRSVLQRKLIFTLWTQRVNNFFWYCKDSSFTQLPFRVLSLAAQLDGKQEYWTTL